MRLPVCGRHVHACAVVTAIDEHIQGYIHVHVHACVGWLSACQCDSSKCERVLVWQHDVWARVSVYMQMLDDCLFVWFFFRQYDGALSRHDAQSITFRCGQPDNFIDKISWLTDIPVHVCHLLLSPYVLLCYDHNCTFSSNCALQFVSLRHFLLLFVTVF